MTGDRRKKLRLEATHDAAPTGRGMETTDAAARIGLLESVFAHANDAVLITAAGQLDQPGPGIVYVNEAFVRMTGYEPGDVLGRNPRLLQGPDTSPKATRRIREALERGEPIREELLNYRKDGSPFYVELDIVPVPDEEGRITHFASIQRDTTERRRAEEALRETEARFSTALEYAPIGMALVGLDGRFLMTNRALRDILGYSDPELRGLTFQELTHPDDLDADLALARRLEAGEIRSYDMEKRYFHKDGRTIRALLAGSLVKGSRQEPLYFIAQIQDVTERRKIEEAQRFVSRASEVMSASLDVNTILTDLTGLLVPLQADYCLVELVTNDGSSVHHAASRHRDPEDQPLLDQLARVRLSGESDMGTRPILRTGMPELVPSVSDAWIEAAARTREEHRLLSALAPTSQMEVPLRVRDRVIGGIILARTDPFERYDQADLATLQDLAGRVALALENALLYREVNQALRARDEVMRIVAHDLRTPLNTIGLSASTLHGLIQNARTPEGLEHLEVIGRSVRQADRLIQDLLDAAVMESKTLSIVPTMEEATGLVRQAVEMNRASAASRGLRLESEAPEHLPSVHADHHRILQVFSNLITNAIKATPEGGRIRVGGDRLGDEVVFFVADEGRGISEEEMPRLFEPFWQAEEGEGAGLGLPIARGIIEAHGGRIDVESRVGIGTTCRFTLPAVEGGTAPEDPGARRAG